MGLYNRLAATALQLLIKFGQPVIRSEISISAYNPPTSSAVKTATETTRTAALSTARPEQPMSGLWSEPM